MTGKRNLPSPSMDPLAALPRFLGMEGHVFGMVRGCQMNELWCIHLSPDNG